MASDISPTGLQAALASGKFALTAEVTPPCSVDPEDLLRKALPLRGLADAVNVTDGAGARAQMDAVVAAALMVQNGVEPVLQLATRDRNRIALQSALLGAAALGVRNLMFIKGDDPSKGDQPDAKAVYDLEAADLAATAVRIRDQGELPSGRKVSGHAAFFVGTSDAPVDPAPGWAPARLKQKVEGGAQFAQTQFCMDADVVRRYAARLREHGVSVPLLIGVAPLASARQTHWIKDNLFGSIIPDSIVARMDAAADAKAEGKRICVEFMRALTEIPGVAGAHVMAPMNDSAIPEVLAEMQGARSAR